MNVRRVARLSVLAMAVSSAVAMAAGVAAADGPSPGDPCPVLHQTATDVDGNTMWCNPMMTGTHALVWQYGGPA
jgi:hypothetical protein